MSRIETVTIKAPPPVPLSAADVRQKHYQLMQRRQSLETLREALEQDTAAVRERARADGHAALWNALENPPPPSPAFDPGPLARCRLLTQISTEHGRPPRPLYAMKGAVVAWPRPIVDSLVKHGHAERVGEDTPLYQPPMPYVP